MEPAPLLSQPKRFAVLVYLVLSRANGSLSRDRLLGMFWPESGQEQARNALRQTLSYIRTCVGPDIIVNAGAQALTVRDDIHCDAIAFESLLTERRSEEALRVYRGDFLPGFYVRGADGFMQWLDERRGYYRQRAAKAAWDLSVECEGLEDGSGAAFWGKRALALSPFSESEVQRLLRLLTRVGDYAGALRAYHGLQGTLRDEFGLDPSSETTRLAAEVRQRLDGSGVQMPALLGTRRSGGDRRGEHRRVAAQPFAGPEKRSATDRRQSARRSGIDRRALRDPNVS